MIDANMLESLLRSGELFGFILVLVVGEAQSLYVTLTVLELTV